MKANTDLPGALQLHHHYLSVSKQFDQAIADRSSSEYLKELLAELESIIEQMESQSQLRKLQLRFDI